NFQFRFRSVGRLSGLYDAWHVDYVFMNRDINPNSFFTEEIACSQNPEYFLSNYSAMPLNQYLVAPFRETNFNYSTTLNNLSDPATQDAPSFTFTLENFGDTLFNQERPNFILDGDAQNSPIVENSFDSTFLANNVLPILSADPNRAQQITSRFNVSTQDSDALFGPNADFRINDTISRVTELGDFYAYDDGTAEFGIGINQRFGQVAVRFLANEPDTITDVLFHLTKLERDLTGITFNLTIWQDINNITGDSVLFKINVPVRYAEERNGFLSIKDITKLVVGDTDTIFRFEPTVVRGVFYIGWEQTTNDRLTMGFDRNNDSTADIFFNIGDRWESFEVTSDDSLRQKERGSIMIRPVFGQASTVVTSVEQLPEPEISIFPNPSDNQLFIEGDIPVSIQFFDLYGRLIKTQASPRGQNLEKLSVSELPSGTYILKGFYPNGQQIFRRIVIQH
ncbi:MAG: T9SS type A sorting domain-containing protein, partial [Bacteroidota bacterium]